MVLELPTYKVPSLRNALLTAKDQGADVPADRRHRHHRDLHRHVVAERVSEGRSRGPEVQALRAPQATRRRGGRSPGARGAGGQLRRPARAPGGAGVPPLGFDWQLTVGVLTSFLAREVFVSTMSVLVGGGGDAEVDEGVIARIHAMTRSRRLAGVHAGDGGRGARVLRARDAVPADARRHPPRDRATPIRAASARLHVHGRLRRRAHPAPGPSGPRSLVMSR